MIAQVPLFDASGARVGLRRPSSADRGELIALSIASAEYLHPWIDPPKTTERFETYLGRLRSDSDHPTLVCERTTGQILGVINISCIVRGFFQSAYLGYWIGAPFARRGLMGEALRLLINHAFRNMSLHRLEANIQPENVASIALVRSCGFVKEDFSPKYLQVFGEWRDHERWALRSDQSDVSR